QPRRVVASLSDAGEGAHTELADPVEVERLHGEPRRATGDLGRAFGEALGCQLVWWRVGQIARAIRPLGDDRRAPRGCSGVGIAGNDREKLEPRRLGRALPPTGIVGA